MLQVNADDVLLAADDVQDASVAVGEQRHRQSVVPHEVEYRERLTVTLLYRVHRKYPHLGFCGRTWV